MRITQGTFSFLPVLTDTQITAQIEYCLARGWAVFIEYADDAHQRNTSWEMYGNPMCDLDDQVRILMEINNCRRTFANRYVRVKAFDPAHGTGSVVMSFLVNRPEHESRFRLIRTEEPDRSMRDAAFSHAVHREPEGARC
ncbi:MAG: ribulose bisphosphate carboxylase small subunit [Pseudomonadota bacterium]